MNIFSTGKTCKYFILVIKVLRDKIIDYIWTIIYPITLFK